MVKDCPYEGEEQYKTFCSVPHQRGEWNCPMSCGYGRELLDLRKKRMSEDYMDWAYKTRNK